MGLKERINKFFKYFIYVVSGEERRDFYAMRKHIDDDHKFQMDDDNDFLFKKTYNPATGFTMNGAVDCAGNNYGCSSGMDYSSSHNNQMDYYRDPFNNFEAKYY